MGSATDSQDGVTILPIPPALDFPDPCTANSSAAIPDTNLSTSSQAHNATAAYVSAEIPKLPGPGEDRLPKSVSLPDARSPTPHQELATKIQPPQQRTSILRRSAKQQTGIDRPRGQQHASIMGNVGRARTENKRNVRNASGRTSDSSSSSSSTSSSDDERAGGPVTGRSTWGRQHAGQNLSGGREPAKRSFDRYQLGDDDFKTKGRVSKRDGRLNISLKETKNQGYLAKALGATLHHVSHDRQAKGESEEHLTPLRAEEAPLGALSRRSTESTAASVYDKNPIPKLNIVVMVIGSRGDIQPFLRLGKILKEDHGHRVRIATHPAFKTFVEQDSGLEFFSVGGDPSEIMAFMVKNPGLIPNKETLKSGEIGRRRESMYQMFKGFWHACINETDDEMDSGNRQMMANKHPFIADVIIANPPSFAHVHCAERLGVPLHLMFTFPMSPTQQFPHPLCNIKQSNVDANYTNFMTYPLVEMMMWQGLGDLVNKFREQTLGLEPVSTLWAPGQLFRLKVPYTYLWSPSLIPKPADWGPEIDITGFVFLDLASSFKPPETLIRFLDSGDPPVYIGFGSIVVDDPDKFTVLIFEAVKKAGVRALVSKGWGGLGDEDNTPDNIYMLENTPHDWLFPRVKAVIHHGGAGTSAIGLKCGKPTMVVPFFGDQPFWGAMVANAGAGADPVPYKSLTIDKLADGIKQLLTPQAQANAEKIAKSIRKEGDGAINAVSSFHRRLPLRGDDSLRCSILERRVAVWSLKETPVRLSALAAEILIRKRRIRWKDLRLLRHCEWNDFEGPGEPLSGAGAAFASSISKAIQGVGRTPYRITKTVRKHQKQKRKEARLKLSSERCEEDCGKTVLPQGNGQARRSDVKQGTLSDDGHDHGAGNAGKCEVGVSEATNQSSDPCEEGVASSVDNKSLLSERTGDDNVAQEIVADTAAGLAKTGGALAKAPMNLAIAIAQGFHNAPRLYGDSTVRKPTRITGIQSGLRAASQEFYYGVYDGWTGLLRHPYNGAKEGPVGFVKGIGKGVGGFVLKDLSAVFGPIGFTLKGMHKELLKKRQPTAFIMDARMMQGEIDFRKLDEQEKVHVLEDVEMGWRIIVDLRLDREKKKSHGIRGQIALRKERKRWRKNGVYESVEQAGRALQAEQRGEDFEEVFKQHRHELKQSSEPRKSTMGNAHRRPAKEKKERETATDGDMRQSKGTVIAGEHAGTEPARKATGAVQSPVETLINKPKTTDKLSRRFHRQVRPHVSTATGQVANGGRLELSNNYADEHGQDQWFQPDATEPQLWMAQTPGKKPPSIRKRSSGHHSGYRFQNFAPHSPVVNGSMRPGDALRPASRQSFRVGSIEPVSDLETNPDINGETDIEKRERAGQGPKLGVGLARFHPTHASPAL
ncbi:hypothetical protein MMC13_003840 [Lambiella insularis]|nr:hypothetical protein [Lambiella insularis]